MSNSEVQRYDADPEGRMVCDEFGGYVTIEDYEYSTKRPDVVHFQGQKNTTFECTEEKQIGTLATDHIGKVTCLDCLKALITTRIPEFMEPDIEQHCGECANLNYTEAEQDVFFAEHGIKPQHNCSRFSNQIFHAFPFEGRLRRHASCNLVRGFEAR